jgi:hypothetical protein
VKLVVLDYRVKKVFKVKNMNRYNAIDILKIVSVKIYIFESRDCFFRVTNTNCMPIMIFSKIKYA